jgi:hypothetical protein
VVVADWRQFWVMAPSVVCADFFHIRGELTGEGSKFKVQGSKFKVQGSKFKVQGSTFKVQGSRFKVEG